MLIIGRVSSKNTNKDLLKGLLSLAFHILNGSIVVGMLKDGYGEVTGLNVQACDDLNRVKVSGECF